MMHEMDEAVDRVTQPVSEGCAAAWRAGAVRYADHPEFFDTSLTISKPRLPYRRWQAWQMAADVLGVRRVSRPLRWRCGVGILRGLDPLECVRSAIQRQHRQWIRSRFPAVYDCQLAAREGGGLLGNYQFARLWEIAELIECFRPARCLELGTGASSAMFAHLLQSQQRFVTVEESPHWYERAQRYLKPFLDACTSVLAERLVTELDSEPVAHYRIDHRQEFDLVYVDGPTSKPGDEISEQQRGLLQRLDPRGGHMADVDVELMWREGVYPRVIVIDGRRATIRRLVRVDPGRYLIFLKSDYYRACTGQFPEYHLYHTLLVRKDQGVSELD